MKPLLPIIAALGILTTTACGAHAQRMLEQCTTTDMIRCELLDIRAREALIRSRMYPEAAQAYIQGFRHYIQESGDTLANTLFGSQAQKK